MTATGHLSAKSLCCVVFPVAVTRVPFHSRGGAGKKHENKKWVYKESRVTHNWPSILTLEFSITFYKITLNYTFYTFLLKNLYFSLYIWHWKKLKTKCCNIYLWTTCLTLTKREFLLHMKIYVCVCVCVFYIYIYIYVCVCVFVCMCVCVLQYPWFQNIKLLHKMKITVLYLAIGT